MTTIKQCLSELTADASFNLAALHEIPSTMSAYVVYSQG